MNKFAASLLPIFIFVVFQAGALPSPTTTPAQAENLARDLEVTKEKLVADEVKQRRIMSSLFDVNRKMKKIVTERAVLVQERMVLEENTRMLAQKIETLDAKVSTQKSFLRQRLSVIYRFGGQGMARLLFSSTSSSELERNLKILGAVAKRDLDLIKDYSGSVKDLEKKRAKLTRRLAHLNKVEKNIRSKEASLIQENNYKNRILDGIRKSKKFALMKLSNLRERSEQLAMNDDSGVLDLLFRPSFFEQKGQLPQPVKGRIVRGFGLIRDDVHNVILSHKGLFFSTSVGSPVKSVFAGKVAYVGIIPGYGQTLVIDHGDHYYTVYGHNQTITVQQGDEVKQSQVVATTGSSLSEYGDGLYFEVRHFSEPYDPRSWMKGSL